MSYAVPYHFSLVTICSEQVFFTFFSYNGFLLATLFLAQFFTQIVPTLPISGKNEKSE